MISDRSWQIIMSLGVGCGQLLPVTDSAQVWLSATVALGPGFRTSVKEDIIIPVK